MKTRTFASTAAIALLALLASPVNVVGQGRSSYTVTNLGTAGGSASAAISITNPQWIAGFSALSGDQATNAVLWRHGTLIPLGTLGGPNSGMGWPNHAQNAVVGLSETSIIDPLGETWSCAAFMPTTGHTCLGFYWRDGVMHALPTLGGNNGYASGANAAGQVVGWAETNFPDPTCVSPQVLQFQAVLWDTHRGTKQVLAPLPGDPDSAATAINNNGVAVGISGICENAVGDQSARHAVLWRNGQPTEIGNLGGQAWHTPTAINQRGEVVGFSQTPDGSIHAFVWTSSAGIRDLGTLPGDTTSFAWGVNEKGQIVGQSIGPNGSRAVLWQNGDMVDLTQVSNTSFTLLYANDIDDSGRLVGQAFDPDTGDSPAFEATPTQGDLPVTAQRPGATNLPQSVWDSLQRWHGLPPIR